MPEDEKKEIKSFSLMKNSIKLGSSKKFLVYVSSIKSKTFVFLWYKLIIKKIIVITQNWVTQAVSRLSNI